MNRFLDSVAFIHPYAVAFLLLMLVILAAPGCATSSADSTARSRDFATTAVLTAGGDAAGQSEFLGHVARTAKGELHQIEIRLHTLVGIMISVRARFPCRP